jgi:hypothetical protein
MKYIALRSLLATGLLDWATARVFAVAVGNHTFNETDTNLFDMQLGGVTVLSVAPLMGKEVTTDGWASSQPVLLPVVQSGGPYDLILFLDTNGDRSGYAPLVCFDNAITTATNGDVIVRPEGFMATNNTGKWFQF